MLKCRWWGVSDEEKKTRLDWTSKMQQSRGYSTILLTVLRLLLTRGNWISPLVEYVNLQSDRWPLSFLSSLGLAGLLASASQIQVESLCREGLSSWEVPLSSNGHHYEKLYDKVTNPTLSPSHLLGNRV